MGKPKFEIFKGKNQEFYFHLKAGNGEIILASQKYTQKANAIKGIESVKNNSVSEVHFERKTSTNDKHYFVLNATNGQVVGTSQMYTSASARDHGIFSVHENANEAAVLDQS
jgi:hypothetical protein